MARDIDAKLRLTAAVLGAVTCKDLAAEFRRVNPATTFDVDRAHKWLQGRAHPRERQVYEDWASLLDLGRPGDWIADCDTEDFLDAICARYRSDRETLRRRAERSNKGARHEERGHMLVGAYACYSHAQSPYHRGRIVRGALVIETAARRTEGLVATYSQAIALGRVLARGRVMLFGRAMCIHLHVPNQDVLAPVFCSLLLPTPPASVLAGVMCGTTAVDPGGQPPYATRIVMVRVPAAVAAGLEASNRYVDPTEGPLSGDLAAIGLPVLARSPELDARLDAFLRPSGDGLSGSDQIRVADYVGLVTVCDRLWLDGDSGRLA